jgi:integrase
MAYITTRKNRDGEVTSYQVKWRLGGARTAPWQTERFEDEDSAKVFQGAVNEAGQQWPPGWVKGRGYVDESDDLDERYVFRAFATEIITNRVGVEEDYRHACLRDLEKYIFPTFGNCDVRSTEHFSSRTVQAWVKAMSETWVFRGSKYKPMSPKTLKNLHGLLSGLLNEAVKGEPPLRDRNPCERTRLPRIDDDGAEDDEGEDMEFLEPHEVEGIVSFLARPADKLLVRVAYATGMRWGELSALARRHAKREGDKCTLRVARAWKRKPKEGFYLGKPKSKQSRRTIRIPLDLWEELEAHGITSLSHNALIFHNGQGERLPYSTFYERWIRAVAKAKADGVVTEYKFPTFHDLRHSHAAALLSSGQHSLTYVQRRLGHESITTTSDRYGHLLPEADDAAMETISRVLGSAPSDEAAAVAELEVPVQDNAPAVYVLHLEDPVDVRLAFWRLDHAEETARVWQDETGGESRVEKMTEAWWVRTYSGGNGVKDVRREPAQRVRLWWGSALYLPDGTQFSTGVALESVTRRWVWDWEDQFTGRSVVTRVRYESGPLALTSAAAWGEDEEKVRAGFTEAREEALRMCSQHPTVAGQPGQGDRTYS